MTAAGHVTGADTAIFEGLRSAGIHIVLSLPDSILHGVAQLAERDPEVRHLVCTREDEGLAVAAGAFLGGRLCALVMEGSGIGYSALILARMLLQRTPALVLASHNRVFGERYDYHGAGRLSSEGVLAGLGVPYAVITDANDLTTRVRDAAVTAAGQRQPVALLFAPTVTGRS
jgi:sulfopyruvate decarboxylase TPP-binding subunit